MTKKKNTLTKTSKIKLLPWREVVPLSVLPLQKNSRAVIVDKKGTPQLFILDTLAFLDILSEIDERLSDHLPSHQYYSKKINPAGWLIDKIEAKLPLSKSYIHTLKDALEEAKDKGWIPFEDIVKKLHLT
jgi:hypothetical protein